MNPSDTKWVILNAGQTTISALSTANSGYVDTKGFNYLQLGLFEGSASAATAIHALEIGEDDTVPTAFTDMAKITALCAGTVVDTTNSFIAPTPSSAAANYNNYRFNIDLRGRKRYIGLSYEPAVTARILILGILSRPEESPAMVTATNVTATSLAHQCRWDKSL